MVQEVQTWVWITNETTLETIEAIGTSSFKIVEWRQTKGGHYVGGCKSSCSIYYNYQQAWGNRDSGLLKWNVNLTESVWKAEFIKVNGGIRVPVAWSYEISYKCEVGSSVNEWGIYIKRWTDASSPNIFSLVTTSGSKTKEWSFIIDLGKFEILTVWTDFHYSGSAGGATLNHYFNYLNVTQL